MPTTTRAALAGAIALDNAAKAGAIHPNAAARRKSRLTLKVNAALGGEPSSPAARSCKTTGKAAAAKAAKARIAAGKAAKAKGAQTAAGKARAALSKTARAEAAAAKAARRRPRTADRGQGGRDEAAAARQPAKASSPQEGHRRRPRPRHAKAPRPPTKATGRRRLQGQEGDRQGQRPQKAARHDVRPGHVRGVSIPAAERSAQGRAVDVGLRARRPFGPDDPVERGRRPGRRPRQDDDRDRAVELLLPVEARERRGVRDAGRRQLRPAAALEIALV